jgi:acyl-CoA thioester hydrolase
MAQKPFVWRSRLRWGDTDASGRVYYVSLFRHLEASEMEFLRNLGYVYATGALETVTFPRVHAECDYTSALVNDDMMDIAVTVEKVGRSSFTLAFDVSVESRNAARGKVTVVCMDRATQKATALPQEFADTLRAAA